PARAGRGTKVARGAATSMNSIRRIACIIPEKGLRAPALMLVAVRAIVPVTLIPPNRADATLAMPWATSSMFDRCRRPVMPSATLAERRLSTPPRSVKESAAGNTCQISGKLISGSRGTGRLLGTPPNRVPIVSTGRCSKATAAEAATTAISIPGQPGRERLQLGNHRTGLGALQRQAAEISQLTGQDGDRDAACETDSHGMRNVTD